MTTLRLGTEGRAPVIASGEGADDAPRPPDYWLPAGRQHAVAQASGQRAIALCGRETFLWPQAFLSPSYPNGPAWRCPECLERIEGFERRPSPALE